MLEHRGSDGIVVRLSPRERASMWAAVVFALGISLLFVVQYVWPKSINPRLESGVELLFLPVLMLAALIEFLRVGVREEWYRAEFVFNTDGVVKKYPSGREEVVKWDEIDVVYFWRHVIKTRSGRKMILAYFGTIGFGRNTLQAIYDMAGHESLFVRQYTGQEKVSR